MTDSQRFIKFGDFKKMLYLCTRNWETPKSVSLNLVLMFNRTIMYAKLAWVYANGMCDFRHQVFNSLKRICQ
jgi:hypothetical protein